MERFKQEVDKTKKANKKKTIVTQEDADRMERIAIDLAAKRSLDPTQQVNVNAEMKPASTIREYYGGDEQKRRKGTDFGWWAMRRFFADMRGPNPTQVFQEFKEKVAMQTYFKERKDYDTQFFQTVSVPSCWLYNVPKDLVQTFFRVGFPIEISKPALNRAERYTWKVGFFLDLQCKYDTMFCEPELGSAPFAFARLAKIPIPYFLPHKCTPFDQSEFSYTNNVRISTLRPNPLQFLMCVSLVGSIGGGW